MKSNSTPWIVAGVAVVLLVVVAWLWLGAKRDLESVLADSKQDITSQRAVIAEKCTGPNADQDECDAALDEMADILRDFNANLETAATTSATVQ